MNYSYCLWCRNAGTLGSNTVGIVRSGIGGEIINLNRLLQKYSMHVYVYFFYMTHAALFPFLGLWFYNQGLTNQQIGMIYSVGPLVGLFVQPIWGILSDRFGWSRKILMLNLLIWPIVAFGYKVAGDLFYIYIVTAVLLTVFSCAINPIQEGMTVSHAKRYRQSYGSIRVLGSISFAIAVTPIGLLYNRIGIENMFFVFLVTVLAAFIVLQFIPHHLNDSGEVFQKKSIFHGVQALFKKRYFVYFLITVLFVSMGTSFSNTFYSVYIGTLGGEASGKLGFLNTISALSELPIFILSGRLIKRYGYFPVLTFVALAGSLRWLILSFEPSFTILMINQLLHGITFALFMAAAVNFVFELSPEGSKTTGQTLFAVINGNMAVLVASNVGGWMVDVSGFPLLFRFASVLSLIGAVGFILLSRSMKRNALANQEYQKMHI